MEDNPDFSECVALLNSHQVHYLIVGSHALAIHGHPRYTKDLDIWVERSPRNARSLLAALIEFGFGGVGLSEQDFVAPGRVIQLGYAPSRIDFLTDLEGLDFAACYPKRVVEVVNSHSMPFIDRESLIVNKRALARPQDLVDADLLELGKTGSASA